MQFNESNESSTCIFFLVRIDVNIVSQGGKETYIRANRLVVSTGADDVDVFGVDIGAYLTSLRSATISNPT